MASWDRQEGEPKTAFDQFVQYRDMGPERSLAKLGQILGVSKPTLEEKSSRWNWVARTDQFDAAMDVLARKAYVTELEKQARQRAQAHSALLGVALKVLTRKDLVESAKLSEATAAVKVATEGMRVEAGLATAKLEVEVVNDPEAAKRQLFELVRGADMGADPEPASGKVARGAAAGADRVPAKG